MAMKDPRRTVTWLGTVSAGILFASLAGAAAASYAVSGVDPIYSSGIGLRAPRTMPDRSLQADVTPQTASAFPSIPGDQYYYYRPPVVTASYDAAPVKPEPTVDMIESAASSDRDATVEGKSDPQVVDVRAIQPIADPSTSGDDQITETNAATE